MLLSILLKVCKVKVGVPNASASPTTSRLTWQLMRPKIIPSFSIVFVRRNSSSRSIDESNIQKTFSII